MEGSESSTLNHGARDGLDPFDRQIIVAYLEGMDASSIGEMTGLSPGAVATKIYRIKIILSRRFQQEPGA